MFLALIIYRTFRKYSEYILCTLFPLLLGGLYFYISSLENYKEIFKFFNYTSIIRLLINLTSWNSNCFGTIFIQQCNQKNIILDLNNHPVFSRWDNLTGQSAFFTL